MSLDNSRQEAKRLLQKTRGRITTTRLDVLSLLLEAKTALNHPDIEKAAQQHGMNFDRVTLYRALDWLVEKGFAHKVAGADRSWHYNALLESRPRHAHFHCTQCHQVFCLENIQPAFMLSLPSGYQLEEVELNLQGRCPDCH
ncbi:MAG: transcriptional repressor [Proteobacteria bacterium]|nr:MAG: transcriptional repressor [Pseudomonadota bacterium]